MARITVRLSSISKPFKTEHSHKHRRKRTRQKVRLRICNLQHGRSPTSLQHKRASASLHHGTRIRRTTPTAQARNLRSGLRPGAPGFSTSASSPDHHGGLWRTSTRFVSSSPSPGLHAHGRIWLSPSSARYAHGGLRLRAATIFIAASSVFRTHSGLRYCSPCIRAPACHAYGLQQRHHQRHYLHRGFDHDDLGQCAATVW